MKKEEVIALWTLVSRGLSERVKSEVLVTSSPTMKLVVRDYVHACGLVGQYLKYHPESDLSEIGSVRDLMLGLPVLDQFRMQYYSPCLACRIDELPQLCQDECYDLSKWVATEKINGMRCWLCISPDDVKLYSRFYDPADCTLVDYWGSVLQSVGQTPERVCLDVEVTFNTGYEDFVEVDAEMGKPDVIADFLSDRAAALEAQRLYREETGRDLLVFHLIAPLYYRGVNYIDKQLGEGMQVYGPAGGYVAALGINVVAIKHCVGTRTEKENFLNCIIANGGEGVVFHNREGRYHTTEARSRTSFVKVKRGAGVNTGLGDTVDAFITGYKLGTDGLISVLEFSVWMNDRGDMIRKFVGNIGGIGKAAKSAMTVMDASGMYPQEFLEDDGSVGWRSLNPRWDGAVAELSGAGMSDNCRLIKPELVQWRRDRDMNGCVYTKEWMLSQVK